MWKDDNVFEAGVKILFLSGSRESGIMLSQVN